MTTSFSFHSFENRFNRLNFFWFSYTTIQSFRASPRMIYCKSHFSKSKVPRCEPKTGVREFLPSTSPAFTPWHWYSYGHFIERVMYLKNPTAAAHYKFIYSFHMLLFLILAGYVASGRDLQLAFVKYLQHRVLSRLLPFVFFTAPVSGLAGFLQRRFLPLAAAYGARVS